MPRVNPPRWLGGQGGVALKMQELFRKKIKIENYFEDNYSVIKKRFRNLRWVLKGS